MYNANLNDYYFDLGEHTNVTQSFTYYFEPLIFNFHDCRCNVSTISTVDNNVHLMLESFVNQFRIS